MKVFWFTIAFTLGVVAASTLMLHGTWQEGLVALLLTLIVVGTLYTGFWLCLLYLNRSNGGM